MNNQVNAMNMGRLELLGEIERVMVEIEEHRQEIASKEQWLAECRAALTGHKEHDGCFFLDGMSREELVARMEVARGEHEDAQATLRACEARLLLAA